DDKKAAFLAEVKEEKDDFAREVRDLMARGTVDIARNLFGQFERESLEEHLFDALIRKIGSFSEEKKEGAAMDDDGRFVLVSAGKVDEEKKTKLKDALDASRFEVSELEYREDDSLVAGYVLQMQDYTIFSSISHYMDKKEQQMVEYFEQAVEDRSEQYDTQK
ncbi:MAG TPA: F0F1 ATP synthase subunit delta, partial [Bacteroidales bacterium]|nr:F0F1 ATP synthase subunit delta [Bacteroidales bacterium]